MSRLSYVGEYIRQLNKDHINHHRKVALTSVLAFFVVFFVLWNLKEQGISLTNEVDCGMEEHIHTEDCYQLYQICGLSEGEKEYVTVVSNEGDEEYTTIEVPHAHTEECYEKELICEEIEHNHTVACVDIDGELVVGIDALTESDNDTNMKVSDATNIGEEVLSKSDIVGEGDIVNLANISNNKESIETLPEIGSEEEIILNAIRIDPDSPEDMIRKAYADHVAEMEKPEGQRDQSKLLVFGRYYVVTATGLRYKDRINETLEGGYNANTADSRYVLYQGAPLTLVVFRDPSMTHWLYVGEGGGSIAGNQRVPLSDDGYDAIYSEVSGGEIGTHSTFSFERGDGSYDNFYTYVRGSGNEYFHSDIEISDGGFFKIQTRRNFEGGGYQIVKTRYDSYVSDVYKCNLYFDNGTPKLLFPGSGVPNDDGVGLDPSDPDNAFCGPGKSVYTENTTSGSTQFELTSAWTCNGLEDYKYQIEHVQRAVFSVELSLAPMKSEIETYDAGGNLIDKTTKDFAKDDGTYDYTVTPIEVELGRQSIVDAMNKCPVHNGMDFNLLYKEINLNLVQPADADFKLTKYLDAEDTYGHNVGEFTFELLDDQNNVISTVNPNVTTGAIKFPIQDYPIPGKYKYKIREVIPAGAVEIEPGVFYKDLVVYDGRVMDVVVDVYLTREIMAIVESEVTPDDVQLRADVHYYINGEEISRSANGDIEYHNRLGNYRVKDLIVKKEWVGAGSHEDNVTFRIIRTRNNTTSEYYSIDEKTVFELNDSNSWEMKFERLPVIIGTDAYSYEVVETMMLNYSPNYVRTDTEDKITYTIKNITNDEKYLHFKKIWTDDEGNTIAPPEGRTSVSLKLMREYKELELPVNVKIQPVGGGTKYSNEFDLDGYNGGSVEFKLETKSGQCYQLDLASSKNCNFSRDGDKYIISNIQQGAEIILQYPVVTSGDLIYWSTAGTSLATGTGYGQWDNNGGYLNHCFSTFWSNNGNPPDQNGDGATADALSLLGRTGDWNYAFFRIDPDKCIFGQQYSFSAYIMYRMESRDRGQGLGEGTAVTQAPTELKIQLNYNIQGESDKQYVDIAKISAPTAGNWYQVQNTGFKIPDNAYNLEIQVNTTEVPGNDRYVDLYFDDVIIAPYMYKAGVEENTGNLTTTRLFNLVDERRTVPTAALDWTPEGQVKAFTVESSSGWAKSIKLSELGKKTGEIGEIPGRAYRYYVVENPIPEKFKAFYYDDYVAYNDASTPITVENQYRAYVLPNTGGIGSNRIRWLGAIVLFIGIFPVMVNLVRKRGGPG